MLLVLLGNRGMKVEVLLLIIIINFKQSLNIKLNIMSYDALNIK